MVERAKLERTLRPANVWALALGTIIGWGCFILPGDCLSWSGPLGAILGMVAGAVLRKIVGQGGVSPFALGNDPVDGDFTGGGADVQIRMVDRDEFGQGGSGEQEQGKEQPADHGWGLL